ncbi:cysteine peptidase family C39 domain-containing protein [Mucilaginibacter sp. PAMB04274]|uniref:cysteine peptidase family C39 domain-containing protein n=1 Tax=Mucilaginibacter sp. PAMB04274 TaxID=3138568 RepID=UPI0031F6091A
MKNINLLKRTFVRQTGQDECGNSCLAMILNYSGLTLASRQMRSLKAPPGGYSLLSLKELAFKSGLNGRCVELEMAFLRAIQQPCILHTLNDHNEPHYQVCYGSKISRKGSQYLMADPAKQFYFITEEELSRRWSSKAALYFEPLEQNLTPFSASPWLSLLRVVPYPVGLWGVLPLMAVLSALLGIALSWVLQKGINDRSILEGPVIAILLCLLLVIGICRAGLGFLRQFILIKVNMVINEYLTERFIKGAFYSRAGEFPASSFFIRSSIRDIQRIQNALSSFLSILLPEGTLVICLLVVIAWNSTSGGLFSVIYMAVTACLAYRNSNTNTYQFSHLSQLSGGNEEALTRDALSMTNITDAGHLQERFEYHLSRQELATAHISSIAISAGLRSLFIEACGAVYAIGLFALLIANYINGDVSYSLLMVMVICGYFASTLMPRLCMVINTLAEGADAFIQYQAFHADRS